MVDKVISDFHGLKLNNENNENEINTSDVKTVSVTKTLRERRELIEELCSNDTEHLSKTDSAVPVNDQDSEDEDFDEFEECEDSEPDSDFDTKAGNKKDALELIIDAKQGNTINEDITIEQLRNCSQVEDSNPYNTFCKVSPEGLSPLLVAVFCNMTKVSEFLVNQINYHVFTSSEEAIKYFNQQDSDGNTVIHEMAYMGDRVFQTLKMLLKLRGVYSGYNVPLFDSGVRNNSQEIPIHFSLRTCLKWPQQKTIDIFHKESPDVMNALDETGNNLVEFLIKICMESYPFAAHKDTRGLKTVQQYLDQLLSFPEMHNFIDASLKLLTKYQRRIQPAVYSKIHSCLKAKEEDGMQILLPTGMNAKYSYGNQKAVTLSKRDGNDANLSLQEDMEIQIPLVVEEFHRKDPYGSSSSNESNSPTLSTGHLMNSQHSLPPYSQVVTQYSQKSPNPRALYSHTSPASTLHSQRSPASTLYSQTSPASTLYSQTSPAPTLYSQTSPASTLYSQTSPASTLFSQTSPASTLYSQTSPASTLYSQTSPASNLCSQRSSASTLHSQISPASTLYSQRSQASALYSQTYPASTIYSQGSPSSSATYSHMSPQSTSYSQRSSHASTRYSQTSSSNSVFSQRQHELSASHFQASPAIYYHTSPTANSFPQISPDASATRSQILQISPSYQPPMSFDPMIYDVSTIHSLMPQNLAGSHPQTSYAPAGTFSSSHSLITPSQASSSPTMTDSFTILYTQGNQTHPMNSITVPETGLIDAPAVFGNMEQSKPMATTLPSTRRYQVHNIGTTGEENILIDQDNLGADKNMFLQGDLEDNLGADKNMFLQGDLDTSQSFTTLNLLDIFTHDDLNPSSQIMATPLQPNVDMESLFSPSLHTPVKMEPFDFAASRNGNDSTETMDNSA